MKKYLLIFATLFLVATLAACRGTTTGTGTGTATGTGTTTGTQQIVNLTYASWGVGDPNATTPNLERLMIQAFNEKYPNIRVTIVERPKIPDPNNSENQIDTPWNEFLTAQASRGELPDVFLTDNVPLSIKNNWVYDITSIAEADAEFKNVSEDITNAGRYNGKVYVLPMAAHYFGFLVNETLFNNANQDAPRFGVEMDDLLDVSKSVTVRTGENTTIGFEGVEHIMHWYPAQINPNLGWFTYDGSKFNLTDPSFRTAVELQHRLYADTSFVSEAIGESLWNAGRQAVRFDGSWALSGLKSQMESGQISDFEFDFIGTPAVNGTQRIPIALDFLTIGSDTQHPQEAYLLAKWMGLGKEGYAKRLNLSTTVSGINPINFAPLQPDQDLLNQFFTVYEGFEEFRKVIEHGNYIVEPVKFLPGYIPARYSGQYDAENNMWSILNKLMHNEITFADHIQQINTKANGYLQEARQDLQQ